VSLDMDFVDPSEAPGVGTPVRGGASYREAHLVMEMIADSSRMLSLEIVGRGTASCDRRCCFGSVFTLHSFSGTIHEPSYTFSRLCGPPTPTDCHYYQFPCVTLSCENRLEIVAELTVVVTTAKEQPNTRFGGCLETSRCPKRALPGRCG